MNKSIFLKLAALTLLSVIAATGCKTKGPKGVTPIYGARTSVAGAPCPEMTSSDTVVRGTTRKPSGS